ncbi:glycosyltransferase [Alkalibacterium pelagium]|uniref:Glycosyltransferase involved in cell wall bisynthesis n=1 Tax=Alkalibacterium pelagium TaxID=426702 RepID=A0A1H7NPI6_9LACT|nr:glycosyltransferase [Alkalibacterium pelagium]GEN51415.1 glycosyl transferase [Alkalibacterium pelagium]SEL25331.1 Glycosyltransferase involved in cell wall bisynthesis [Alkalibacterium pelagium]
MKVLQINSVCGIGSTGRIATDIHDILIEKGHDSYIAYGRGKVNKNKNIIKIGNKLDIFLHVILTRLFDKHGFGSKKATKLFLEKVKKLDPDIIHLHNIHGYFINIELLFDYIKKYNKTVVWTLHDCWSFTGHCTHFEYAACECWRLDTQIKCIQKNKYPTSWIINNSINNFNRKKSIFNNVESLTLITPSYWLKKIVKQSQLRDYPIQVINNGIDTDIFKPRSNNFRISYRLEEKFVILGVASVWNKSKGIDYFINLSNKLNDNEVIVLVGLTETQIREMPKNIIGISKLNNIEKLAEIYSSANVFFNPTLEDTYPTTNLEAISCGTPVVTFNTGGSPESVDTNMGSIVSSTNIDEILNTIRKYYNTSWEKSKEMHEMSLKKFNKNLNFDNYIELYQSLLH